MKRLMSILLLMGLFFSCKAQVPPIQQEISLREDLIPRVENAYYKDIENDLQPLIGTWKYSNGNEVFKITIKKKIHDKRDINYPNSITFYEDVLYGEYKYVDANGTVFINSLGNINNPNMEVYEHLIWGNNVEVEEAVSGFVPVETTFTNPQQDYLSYDLTLAPMPPVTINGQQVERIKFTLKFGRGLQLVPPGQSFHSHIPLGEYVMLEVP